MARNQGKAGGKRCDIISRAPRACCDDDAAVEFLENLRWEDDPCCPHCGSEDVYQMRDRETGEREQNHRWRCRDCAERYTVRTGTVMEESRIPLRCWCHAFWRACASKKGVSAKQIERETGVSYRTALFLMHRVRWAMANSPFERPMMTGIVEADDGYIGGSPRESEAGWHPLLKNKPRAAYTSKTPIIAIVERGGEGRAFTVDSVDRDTADRLIDTHVSPSARLFTDKKLIYVHAGKGMSDHQTIRHTPKRGERRKQYVRYADTPIHTNAVEGFIGLIKKRIEGTHHAVSIKHLQRYLNEAAFVYNTRELTDGERLKRAIQSGDGARLAYENQIAG